MVLENVPASTRMAAKPQLPPWVKTNLRAWTLYLRAKHGGSQWDFAEFIGVSQPVISKAENYGEIGLDALIKMSTACNEKLDDMIRFKPREGSGERTPIPAPASPEHTRPARRKKADG